jgi:predicted Fe-S protein YdhL (DUF1289 family)
MSVESPCVKLCKIEAGICVGCKRTLAELTDWYKLSDQQKLQILNNIKTRA